MHRSKQSTIGERIRFVREMCSLTRKQVEEKTRGVVKAGSLSTFENNQSQISISYLSELLSFYETQGVSVGFDWIISGKGIEPITTNKEERNENAINESSYFLRTNRNAKIITSRANIIPPFINSGDILGVIERTTLSKVLSLYLSTSDGKDRYFVGKEIDGGNIIYFLDTIDIQTSNLAPLIPFYEVLWLRKT